MRDLGWEDDPVQFADPEYVGGANRQSLSEWRREFNGGLEALRASGYNLPPRA
jgi:ABC-type amino acid transport substrate-binding protein